MKSHSLKHSVWAAAIPLLVQAILSFYQQEQHGATEARSDGIAALTVQNNQQVTDLQAQLLDLKKRLARVERRSGERRHTAYVDTIRVQPVESRGFLWHIIHPFGR